jgi:hypothetical protein
MSWKMERRLTVKVGAFWVGHQILGKRAGRVPGVEPIPPFSIKD